MLIRRIPTHRHSSAQVKVAEATILRLVIRIFDPYFRIRSWNAVQQEPGHCTAPTSVIHM
jgi:hypothetical protein